MSAASGHERDEESPRQRMTAWRIVADETGTCNCAWGCPCQFNALQRTAILNIASGKEAELSSDRDKRVARLRVPGLGEFRVEPIKNPVTGEEHRALIKLPNGFEYKEAEMGNCLENYAKLGGKVISNRNCYAQFAAVNWTNA